MAELLLTIYVGEHALVLRIAVPSCALWLGSIRSIDALILAMAGHTLALQAGDILSIRGSHHAELREYVLHRTTIERAAMLSRQPDGMRGCEPGQ